MSEKSFKLAVTQEHIKKGRLSCMLCPVARALKDKFPRSTYVAVMPQYAYVGTNKYLLSRRAQAFISRFDAGQSISPATFILKRI